MLIRGRTGKKLATSNNIIGEMTLLLTKRDRAFLGNNIQKSCCTRMLYLTPHSLHGAFPSTKFSTEVKQTTIGAGERMNQSSQMSFCIVLYFGE